VTINGTLDFKTKMYLSSSSATNESGLAESSFKASLDL